MSYFVRLRRRGELPFPKRDTDAIFSDETGTLKVMDPDGNVEDLASGNGGSQPDGMRLVKDFLFTEPASVTSLPITALDQMAGTVGVAGDHTDVLTAGGVFDITGSTGNDGGGYSIQSVSFNAGVTTVVCADGPFLDSTVDGDVVPQPRVNMDLPAGTTVEDIWVYCLATGWADTSMFLIVGDESAKDTYFNGLSLDESGAMDTVYDPTSTVSPPHDFTALAYPTDTGVYGPASVFGSAVAGGRTHPSGGVRYETDDALRLQIYGLNTGGGTGQILVRVIYTTPIAPVEGIT